jgi:hypothetical protein
MRLAALVCLAAFVSTGSAHSASVVPTTFDEMVVRAGTIFLGEAVNVRSDWETSSRGKHIVTTVTFKVERVLKGEAPAQVQLQFLGGDIGGLVMEVDGMPTFRVGDRDVLFVSPTRNAISPLVGFSNGRFRVTRGRSGDARVLTHDGRPFVAAAASASRSRTLMSAPATPSSYEQFEALVLQSLGRAGVAPR